jgi:hypothetical protein
LERVKTPKAPQRRARIARSGKSCLFHRTINAHNINNVLKQRRSALKASKHIASNCVDFGGIFERRLPR